MSLVKGKMRRPVPTISNVLSAKGLIIMNSATITRHVRIAHALRAKLENTPTTSATARAQNTQ